jgi:hypothetical protein
MIFKLAYRMDKKTLNIFSLLVGLCLLIFISSCQFINTSQSAGEPVAKAYKKYLYKSDLLGLVPVGTSSADSLVLVKNYIDTWVKQQVVLNKAENNLSADQKSIEKQLEDYRNSLLIFAYEKALVAQKLDTVVSNQEIENYYRTNESSFELKDNIIKVVYLKLEKKAPNLDKVKVWYKSNNQKDISLLEEYCHQYAVNFFLDDNTWLLFDDLLKEIPIKTYDKDHFLKNNRFIEITDSNYIYMVNIKGFKIKDSVSPISFEKENIKNNILNQRKLKLIHEMEKKTYLEALNNKEFEIY